VGEMLCASLSARSCEQTAAYDQVKVIGLRSLKQRLQTQAVHVTSALLRRVKSTSKLGVK
jgi:hypothetical protein